MSEVFVIFFFFEKTFFFPSGKCEIGILTVIISCELLFSPSPFSIHFLTIFLSFFFCGNWPFLLGVGGWPFHPSWRLVSPFLGLGLVLPSRVGEAVLLKVGSGTFPLNLGLDLSVCPPECGVLLCPAEWGWWLAVSSWGCVWPFLLVVWVGLCGSSPVLLGFGPFFLG